MANVQVQIIKLAHFYKEGDRGAKGGAPKNDKIWGMAKIGNTLVAFWGRRGGTLTFKTYLKSQERELIAKYLEKTGMRTSGDVYTPINNPSMRDLLVPGLTENMITDYFRAMGKGKLNTLH